MEPQHNPPNGSQRPKWMYSVVLLLSLLLNGFLLLHGPSDNENGHLLGSTHDNNRKGRMLMSEKRGGWSRRAADEAEVAAEYQCSGHGYVFVDTFLRDENGSLVCECNPCYTGLDCSQLVPNCVVDAGQGDPTFLEPFWIANAEAAATVVPPWYRMSYDVNNGLEYAATSPELEKQIRAIHELVGNAVTKGRYIVLGTGSTQLINAAVYSLSQAHNPRNPSKVVAATPYYGSYREQTEMFDSMDYVWKGNARSWVTKAEKLNTSTFIEFVTSPNNPDGLLKKGVLTSKNVRDINDRAYYWPHFTGIPRPADDDVMLFTLSKLTGHAGSRLGWAIVKDYDVYEKMYDYVQENTLGVSHDTQLRASRLLKAVVNGYAQKKSRNEKQLIFHYAYSVMRNRWQRLEKIFSGSDRFSLQTLEPRYCTFFKKVTGPSPAYAWVKCKREEENDCAGVFLKGGIIGRNATAFEADKRYVRLSLLKREDNFALLEHRLKALVS